MHRQPIKLNMNVFVTVEKHTHTRILARQREATHPALFSIALSSHRQ